MHGKGRAAPAELPKEDPHHVAPKPEKSAEPPKRWQRRSAQLDLFAAT